MNPIFSDNWVYAGLLSAFPDIEPSSSGSNNSKTKLRSSPTTDADTTSPCKILQLAGDHSDTRSACELTPDEAQDTIGIEPQVLVFRYRGKLVAIDHCCPHRNYPLSRGSIYDIEDFGIVLSAGITCPGHGWAFDLHTGLSDRGSYKLGVWQTEIRKSEGGEEEVWVRRAGLKT